MTATAPERGPVVVDTGVFSSSLVRRGARVIDAYRPLLEGRRFVVSFITVAGIRYGARLANWGADTFAGRSATL
ncbi:MAG: hypothetical protein ACT4OX_08315 [Actinomycetota bacterium]